MAVSRIIEFKPNSQEARKKKKHDMVGNTAFPPSNGQYNGSSVSPPTVQNSPDYSSM